MDKHLHIICFDIPYPADYGGVFDLFYKIKALHQCGVNIHLHCFENRRAKQDELNKFCSSVDYYQRKTGLRGFSAAIPYIVNSRRNSLLLENLLADNHPILIEGVHCSYILTDSRFRLRKMVLRLHNVEYIYYRGLARTTNSLLQKIYFFIESMLLLKYEKTIANKALVLAVAGHDVNIYKNVFKADRVFYLPVFLPFSTVTSKEGKGTYCLYHGNLSVPENEKAVMWLSENIFIDGRFPFVIAGKNPSRSLERILEKNRNSCVIANPSNEEMQDLIAKAHINILPSFNGTGVKLKLLNALFNGRHCIVNGDAVAGSRLEALCHIANNPVAMRKLVEEMMDTPLTEHDINQRLSLLEKMFNNSSNAEQLIRWIW